MSHLQLVALLPDVRFDQVAPNCNRPPSVADAVACPVCTCQGAVLGQVWMTLVHEGPVPFLLPVAGVVRVMILASGDRRYWSRAVLIHSG